MYRSMLVCDESIYFVTNRPGDMHSDTHLMSYLVLVPDGVKHFPSELKAGRRQKQLTPLFVFNSRSTRLDTPPPI